jgi:hypothetical protein
MLPSLNLNFAETKKLDKRVTFTRNSVGTYFDRNGILKTAAANIPRFDHDPVSKVSLGLLVEESRTNLAVYSEDFSLWGNSNITVATNTADTVAPDGSNNADRLTDTNAAAEGYSALSVTSGVTSADNLYRTFSVFLKHGTAPLPVIWGGYYNGSAWLSYGVKISTAGVGTMLAGSTGSHTITNVGNGWFRVSITVQNTQVGATRFDPRVQLEDWGLGGTGTGTVYVWGAQVEVGAFPTSYIPNLGSGTTVRQADSATMTGTNFTSWYNQSEGSVVITAQRPYPAAATTYPAALNISNSASTTNSILIYNNPSSMTITSTVKVANVSLYSATMTSVANTNFTSATGYKVSDHASIFDGSSITTSSNATSLPTMDRLEIGDGDQIWNGCINSIRYYPKRLTNNQLRSLSLNQLEYYPKESQEFNFGKGDIYQPNIQFTRNDAVATYFDKTGVLRTATNDQPRIDYDPATLECKGLLMEPSRTNGIFNTATSASLGTVSTGTAIGPDGNLAYKFVPTAGAVSFPTRGNGGEQFANGTSAGGTTDFAFSGYFKNFGPLNYKPYIVIDAVDAGNGNILYALVLFDASAGTFSLKAYSGGWTEIQAPSATLMPCGMWYVTWIVRYTQQALLRTKNRFYIQCYNEANTATYTADGSSGFQYRCMQLEIGSVITSYIPTTTTAVTRQAENCIVSGTTFTNWFNTSSSAEYTVLCSGTYLGQTSGTAYPTIYSLSNDSAAERIHLTYDQNFPRLYTEIFDNSVSQFNSHPNNESIVRGTRFNHGLTVGNGIVTTVLDNRVPVSVSGKTLPSCSILRIGAYVSGGSPWHGYIDKVMIYGEQVPTSKLQEMVSDSIQTRNTPTLAFHFDRMSEIPRGITFTRADATTCATYFDKLGVMRTAAANVARFDYDPVTLKNLGLLVEESRTNYITYSEDFTHANWTKANVTALANSIVTPAGNTTSETITGVSGATLKIIAPTSAISITAGTTYTASCYIKQNDARYVSFTFDDNATTNGVTTTFDLLNGTISRAAVTYGTGANATSSITSVGNGWYRITITGTAGTVSTLGRWALSIQSTGTTQFNNFDTTTSFYVWGAQLEAGAFPTSYIPNLATGSTTRAADVATMTGTNFTSWFNKNEGSIIVRGNVVYNSSVSAFPRLIAINDGTGQTECIQCLCATAGNNSYWSVWDNSLSRGYTTGVTTTSGSFNTIACSYDQTTLLGAADGTKGSIDSTLEGFPTMNQLGIGNLSGGAQTNGHVSKFIYYADKLSEDQLRDITRVTS